MGYDVEGDPCFVSLYLYSFSIWVHLWLKDLAQMGLSFGPGLVLAVEGVGLTKGPTLLMMDCCRTSSAVYTFPNP